MDSIQVLDNKKFISDKNYLKLMDSDEKLYWSGEAYKINKRGRRQNRLFIVTNKRLINVGKQGNVFTNLFSKLVKRQILTENITAVTYSQISNNFVLHVPKEYDYYLCTSFKNELLEKILEIKKALKQPLMEFYLVEDIDLTKFTKTEDEKQMKYPPVSPHQLDTEGFKNFLSKKQLQLEDNIKNTEQIVTSKDGDNINENSFEILRTLGKGYFGRVFLVEKKDNKQLYALKVISKLDIIKRNFFEGLKSEKKIMQKINNPFVVNLEYCFANPTHIFFAMKFKQGGELYYHLRKSTRFSEDTARFYASQIISGLAYLHSLNIMYRDMKPENILLDDQGNACLADFGISKVLEDGQSTKSFVGTPEYVAPEIILQKGHDKTVDIWCFGILLYEMVYGLPPFYNKNHNIMLNWVVKLDPTFPKMVKISDDLVDLIQKCLQKEPSKRIGFNNTQEILEHPWFKDVNWEDVDNLKIAPPIKPEIKDKFDIDNFNQDVIKERPKLSDLKEMDKNIVDDHQEKFNDF